MYGYELVAAVEERTGGALEVAGGTMYPVLYRLEQAEHVEAHWVTPERGAARKYYGSPPPACGSWSGRWRSGGLHRALERVLDPEGAPR
jgi:hypothetical protein